MSGLALVAGIGLGVAAKKFYVQSDPLADKVMAVLPASNCGNCGYPGCRAYAEAMATAAAEGGRPVAINRCLPGGAATIQAIADVLGVDPVAVADAIGPQMAVVAEIQCIGCTACIKKCPVDAIVGANKQAHTVIADWCTGCKACIVACPVDCIVMVPVPQTPYNWKWDKPAGPHDRFVS
ncbi:MAG: electron transport complex subunit RsxB [Magnetococcales bacterium]|nr:electron transport complex subunit RsxB [Magnetococcales bacterium]